MGSSAHLTLWILNLSGVSTKTK